MNYFTITLTINRETMVFPSRRKTRFSMSSVKKQGLRAPNRDAAANSAEPVPCF